MEDEISIPLEYVKEFLDSLLNDNQIDFYVYGNYDYEHPKFIKTHLLPKNYMKICEISNFDRCLLGNNRISDKDIDIINNESYGGTK